MRRTPKEISTKSSVIRYPHLGENGRRIFYQTENKTYNETKPTGNISENHVSFQGDSFTKGSRSFTQTTSCLHFIIIVSS